MIEMIISIRKEVQKMSRSDEMRNQEQAARDEQRERWDRDDEDYEGWRIMQENRKNRESAPYSSGGCLSALILLPVMPVINLFRNLFS